jgi:hypothetical protein
MAFWHLNNETKNGGNAAQRLVRLRPMGKLAAIPQESVTVEN